MVERKPKQTEPKPMSLPIGGKWAWRSWAVVSSQRLGNWLGLIQLKVPQYRPCHIDLYHNVTSVMEFEVAEVICVVEFGFI